MAYSLAGERPKAAALSSRPFARLLAWVKAQRARQANRLALCALLGMEDARLDDLGLCRQDILDALATPQRPAGAVLSGRRARRARYWPNAG